jgi:hypothetical protein
MRWMPASLTGSLEKTYREVIDPVYGFDSVATGYRLAQRADPEAQHEGIRILSAALEPGPPREILTQLRRLRVMCAGDPNDDRNLQMAVYTAELMKLPAAALELAISDWVIDHKFWPSYAELVELVNRRLAPARQMLQALEREQAGCNMLVAR